MANPQLQIRVLQTALKTPRYLELGDAQHRLPQQHALEGALSFVVNSTVEVEAAQAYQLSLSDSVVMVRPTDPTRLVQLDRASQNAVMRLGETLTYVQAGIRKQGFDSVVELLPVKNRIDPLATLRLGDQIMTDPRGLLDADWATLATVARHDQPLASQSIPVPVLAQLDLAAQAEGVWAQAAKAIELLPMLQTTKVPSAMEVAAESTLLALYTEGNSLRDWLLVGRAVARIRQIGYRHGIGARLLDQSITVRMVNNLPWRQTLRFGQLQAVLQLGRCTNS